PPPTTPPTLRGGPRPPPPRPPPPAARGAQLTGSTLFRPPHGWLRPCQLIALRRHYRVVMYDLVTRDYSKRLDAARVVENVRRYTRDGSIIVFHDSLKSLPRLREALPASIEWLLEQGYRFEILKSQ
ncbi:MAG: hypothetical protein K2J49_07280, partial [Muribaculaceae bacterium]|nr:hypothetical protein [Muribaculaceae bacterium]